MSFSRQALLSFLIILPILCFHPLRPASGAGLDRRLATADSGDRTAGSVHPHAGSQLVSGTPAAFSFPAVSSPTLFTGDNGFLINVPTGATRLEIRLATSTAGVDVDLHVRLNADPNVPAGGGVPVDDFHSRGPGGGEVLLIEPSGWESSDGAGRRSAPTLQPGNYHIAFAVFTAGIAVQGSIVATVTGGAPPGPPPRAGELRLRIAQEDNSLCPATKKIFASVTDGTGQVVTGLTQANFTLTENGAPRQITVQCNVSSTPASAGWVALLIDVSGSLSTQALSDEQTAAKRLVSQLGPSDRVAVFSFGSSVDLRQEFTTDRSAANQAIDALTRGGSTALYRGIRDASRALSGRTGRKAIVLMTDGRNTVSGVTLKEAIAAAQQAGAPVFPVGFGGFDRDVLSRISNETGGLFFESATSVDLQRILGSIGQILVSQCEIVYTPATPTVETTIELAVVVTAATVTRRGSATRRVSPCTAPPASTTQPGCSYDVSPLENLNVPAAGRAFDLGVRVNTRNDCFWDAISNNSWIEITQKVGTEARPASATRKDGGVSYRVLPNSGSERTGAIQVADKIHTVRQMAGAACSLSFSPPAVTVPGSGATGTVNITATGADCSWAARAQAAWISVNFGSATAGGRGSGPLHYDVAPNSNTSVRTGTIVIDGKNFTVTQQGAGTTGDPRAPANGVVPSASGTPPSLPGGAIALGSFFSVFGFDIGPTPDVRADAFPLPTALGGASIEVRQGATVSRPYIVFASGGQINAIMRSDAPLGGAEMTIIYNGRRSPPIPVRIVRHNFGIFNPAGGRGPGIIQNFHAPDDQPLNTRSRPARRRQFITVWGTGAGPMVNPNNGLPYPDNQQPLVGNLPYNYELRVGGRRARLTYHGRSPCCSAVDQLVGELPADLPLGCNVPVQVGVNGAWSNVVTMAISGDGAPCTDPQNPVSSLPQTGGRAGLIFPIQGSGFLPLEAGKPPENIQADLGFATFIDVARGGDFAFHPLTSLPPVGSCQAFTGNQDLSSILGGALPSVNTGGNSRQLDAGSQIGISGPGGQRTIPRLDTSSSTGPYLGLLGGSIPFPGLTAMPAFLNPGSYRISGPGGADVGAFHADVTFPSFVNWTNRNQLAVIDRTASITVNWSGGGADRVVAIGGGSSDQRTKATAGFLCFASAADGSFTVPSSFLFNLPLTRGTDLKETVGLLGIASMPVGTLSTFSASGISTGYIVPVTLDLRTVEVR